MTDYDEEEHDADDCDDPQCADESAETFTVYAEYTVQFSIQAHSQEQAERMADDMACETFGVINEHELASSWLDSGHDILVKSQRQELQEQIERAALVRQIEDEELSTT